jgi:hypothetical protein
MKTLLVSALFLVACKSEKQAAPAEATKPVETAVEPAKGEPAKAAPAKDDALDGVGSDGLTDGERAKMNASMERNAMEDNEPKFPEHDAAASALGELGAADSSLDAMIDPTSTFGFADHTVTPPTAKEFCGLSSSKDGLAVRSKLEGFRARIAKAATDGNISCTGVDDNRIECEVMDKGTPNLTFLYAYEMDMARVIGFGIDKLDRVKDMGARIELSKSLRARGGKSCGDAH